MGNKKFNLIVSFFLLSLLGASGMLFGQRVIDLDKVWGDMRLLGDDAYDYFGYAVASGDINGDGFHDIIIGAPVADAPGGSKAGETHLFLGGGTIITAHGLGGSGWIKGFSLMGRGWGAFKAFGPVNSLGEVHLAVGDIDGDGLDEIAAGQGEGGSSWFKLFRANGTLIRSFKAFGPANAQGEVHLVSGDLDNNGVDEIIAGMGEDGSSWVKIFNRLGGLIRSFQAFSSAGNPGGEVHVAVGNFDADPSVEIAVSTGYNGGNKVKLFEKDGTFISGFTAFGTGGNPNGDVQITAADINNDGVWEVICAHGEGGSSWVKMFKADGTLIRSFKAFGASNSQGEVHLAKSNY